MNTEQILSIIEINRESLTRNTNSAIADLKKLHEEFKTENDEACQLSLSLNDSLVEMLFYSNYEKAIENSLFALANFIHSGDAYLTAYHHRIVGRCMAFIGQHDSSKIHLEKALEVVEFELHKPILFVQLKGDTLHDLAMLNNFSGGDPQVSIELLQQAIQIMQGSSFEVRRAVCQMAIGIVKYEQAKVEESLESYKLSAGVFEKHFMLKNLGCVFNNMGLCYLKLENFEQSESYLKRALELRLKAGSPDEIANVYFGFALLYSEQFKNDAAYDNLLLCREYATLSKNKVMLQQTTRFINDIEEFRNSNTTASDVPVDELAS